VTMQDQGLPTDGAGHQSTRLAELGIDVFVEWQLCEAAPMEAPIRSRGDGEVVVLAEPGVRATPRRKER
jgi:hypothetical protein